MKRMSLLLLLLAPLCAALHAEDQQFARIGDLKLENGEVIRDCVVGYRTFGIVNPQKSNVVVFPTYLGGRSADLASRIGAGKMVDSSKYYVIAVDSLADGISSSPSNSSTQPRMQFPKISIRDMVNAEHKMLTDSLLLTHVHAVMGFSMGGMQAFQWAVSYPEFMDKIVSIVGSPQLTSWDMLLWRTELLAVEADPDWKNGQYTTQPKLHLLDSVHALVLTTPESVASNTPVKDFEKFFAEQAVRNIAYQTLPASKQDDQEADHYARKRQRKGQHRDQYGTAGKTMTLQEHSGDGGHDQRHNRGRSRQQHRIDQGGAVTRLGQDREIAGEPLWAFRSGDDKMRHRQQEKGCRHHRKRQQA